MFDFTILDAETGKEIPKPARNISIEVHDFTKAYSFEEREQFGEFEIGSFFPEVMTEIEFRIGFFLLSPWDRMCFWGKTQDGEWDVYMVARRCKYIIRFETNNGIFDLRY